MSDDLKPKNYHINADVDKDRQPSDARMHKPFGFLLAGNNSILTKDPDGTLKWLGLEGGGLLPFGYIDNANLNWTSVSQITVGVGAINSHVRGEEDKVSMQWLGTETIDITLTGLGGLFSGPEAADTWYAVHVLGRDADRATGITDGVTANKLIDSTANFTAANVQVGDLVKNDTGGTQARVAAIDSTTQLDLDVDIFGSGEDYTIGPKVAVTMTTSDDFGSLLGSTSYTDWRHVGWVYNDSGSDIRKFFQLGKNNHKEYHWDVNQSVLNLLLLGSATSLSTLDLSALIPPDSMEAWLGWEFNTVGGNATDEFVLRSADSSITKPNVPYRFAPGIQLTETAKGQVWIRTDSAEDIDYAVAVPQDDLSLFVLGFKHKI